VRPSPSRIDVGVQAAVAAGGRIVKAYKDERTWILASPDNHGVDIAGWADLEA
jgi:4a-hydroxytetrahydrobiopterin dehydratase